MASCINSVLYRNICNHQKKIDFLKSVNRTFEFYPNIDKLAQRWNVTCPQLKPNYIYDKVNVPGLKSCTKVDQYVFSSQNLKENSASLFQSTNKLMMDKKRGELINHIVKSQENNSPAGNESPGKPTPDQVNDVAKILTKDLTNFFSRPVTYEIYHHQMTFENEIKGTRTIGIGEYMKFLALLKMVGHLKYAFVEFEILKITTHHSEGTIKVRWSIKGLSGYRVFLNFWRYKVWNLKDTAFKDVKPWYDGFSIYYIDGDGLIYKHVALKMQPDEENEVTPPKINPLTA